MSQDSLDHFLTQLSQRNDCHIAGGDILASWQRCTFATDADLAAVVIPDNRQALMAVLGLAYSMGIAHHVISGGKNWGYGSRLAAAHSSVAISLEKLNRITGFNAETGVVTLEPGVSYAQLQDFLLQNHSRWRLNGPGSSPDASVVANTLQRGLNQGPQMEHWRQVLDMDVVLASGDVVHTRQRLQQPIPDTGPDISGLFFQSDMGVVCQLSLQLNYLPNYWQHLYFGWADESKTPLGSRVNGVMQLQREQVLMHPVSLHNGEKILQLLGQYPHDRAGGKTPLPRELRQQLLADQDGFDWFVESAISAPSATLLQHMREETTTRLAELDLHACWHGQNLPGAFFHDRTQATPDQLYWRKSGDLPDQLDPDRDGCGALWLSPVLTDPLNQLPALEAGVRERFYRFGFEPAISLQLPGRGYLYGIIAIVYDRLQPGEDQKALQLYREIHQLFATLAIPVYRHTILDSLCDGDDHHHHRASASANERTDTHSVLAKIRSVLAGKA